MNKIDITFRKLKQKKEGVLIGFVTAGDPSISDTHRIIDSLVTGEIDLLELGLPFSDPIADGFTIQKSSQRSLESGMNTDKYFSLVKELNKEYSNIPKVCLTYYNLVLQRGLEKFAKECYNSGIDGLIIPDLPIEESHTLLKECKKNNVHLIFLVTPITTDERLKKIIKKSQGFIYLVSLLGVTGVRNELSKSVKPMLRKIRAISRKIPLAVGFGISKPEHVKEVISAGADGVIVGSAFVKIIEKNLKDKKKLLRRLKVFTKKLKEATKKNKRVIDL